MSNDLVGLARVVRARWREAHLAEATLCQMESVLAAFEAYAHEMSAESLTEELVEGYAAKVESEHADRGAVCVYLRPVRQMCDACGMATTALGDFGARGSKKECQVPERFSGIYEAYLAKVAEKRYSSWTVRAKERISRQMLAYLDDEIEDIGELSLADCDGFVAERAKVCDPGILYRELSLIRSFVSFLLESFDLDKELAMFLLDKPKRPPRKPQRFLTDEEAARLLKAADGRRRNRLRCLVIVAMQLQYMVRSCDLARIMLDDIDWIQNTIVIRSSKNGQAQVLDLTESIRYLLLDYLKNARPASPHRNLILTARYPYKPLANASASIALVVNNLAREAGIEVGEFRFGGHALRRTGATMLMDENVEYHVISRILQHKPEGGAASGTTMDYLRLDIERLRPVALEVMPHASRQ